VSDNIISTALKTKSVVRALGKRKDGRLALVAIAYPAFAPEDVDEQDLMYALFALSHSELFDRDITVDQLAELGRKIDRGELEVYT